MKIKMKIIKFKTLLLCTLLLASTVSKAGIINLEDWFDSSGSNTSGLTQSTFNNSLFFAVAKDIDFSTGDTYEVTNGWHIATWSEYASLWNAAGAPSTDYNHYNRNGWNSYTSASGALSHTFFAFQDMFDSNLTNKVAHAGNGPQNTATGPHSASGGYNEQWGTQLATTVKGKFAGLVVIKDGAQAWGTNVSVPEPSTLAIFALGMIGLASRRFKKKS